MFPEFEQELTKLDMFLAEVSFGKCIHGVSLNVIPAKLLQLRLYIAKGGGSTLASQNCHVQLTPYFSDYRGQVTSPSIFQQYDGLMLSL